VPQEFSILIPIWKLYLKLFRFCLLDENRREKCLVIVSFKVVDRTLHWLLIIYTAAKEVAFSNKVVAPVYIVSVHSLCYILSLCADIFYVKFLTLLLLCKMVK
jgi:hypothetical protein